MGPVEVVARGAAARRTARAGGALLRRLARGPGRGRGSVSLLLAGDAEIRRLNRRFRGVDRTTDVLSFPGEGTLEPGEAHLGDIAISVPQAARQARQARWRLDDEMALLVVHGFLHLLGYDHETDDGAMHRLEAKILARVAGVRLDRRRLPWGQAPVRRSAAGRGR